MKNVDVAINVYGKPMQTAATLLSLVRFSGERINKIYFVQEPGQPDNSDFSFIPKLLGDKTIFYTPKHWLWVDRVDLNRLADEDYRHSIRYQYAWEKSTADYLFLTHNDVLYENDVIAGLLDNIGERAGIGSIGQCWNCPAFSAGLCGGDRYLDYRPNYAELIEIYEKFPTRRQIDYKDFIDRENPWTLPECRLNEWVALINLKLCKPETVPLGDATPFGAMWLDIGTRWFKEMSLKGYEFKDYDFSRFAKHAWASETASGHRALFDKRDYQNAEAIAKQKLVRDYGLSETFLSSFEPRESWRQIAANFFKRLIDDFKSVGKQS